MPEEFAQEDINIAHEVGRLRGDVDGLILWKGRFEARIDESIQKLHEQNIESSREAREQNADLRSNVDRQFEDMRQDMHSNINSLHEKFDAVIQSNQEVRRDAEERVPKWAMWLYGTLFVAAVLTGAGWVVDAAIHGHL